MKSNTVTRLANLISARKRILLVGPPGTAKTARIQAAANLLGWKFYYGIDGRTADLMDRLDAAGAVVPDVAAGVSRTLPLLALQEILDCREPAIWFVDEIGRAPIDVQGGLNSVFDRLMDGGCDRRTPIIALGGGVVGDLAGFAAATWQRGVPFIQVPTTLLAQVDSSVGGKTAINHPRGKNMIGAFHQPGLVLADTATLDTLPARELAAGLAEVIKYGLIRDTAFLDWLDANLPALLRRDREALAWAIRRSCEHKAEVVARDEREADLRETLNLGHTFGHAIETAAGYGNWLHGEAVAAGTVLAAEMSARLGWLAESDVARVRRLLGAAGLPLEAPALGTAAYRDLMAHDKKARDGHIRLVLLRALGQTVVTGDYPARVLDATLEECTGHA